MSAPLDEADTFYMNAHRRSLLFFMSACVLQLDVGKEQRDQPAHLKKGKKLQLKIAPGSPSEQQKWDFSSNVCEDMLAELLPFLFLWT